MSAGIQIINDSGTIQITESYNNLQLVEKATVSTPCTLYFGKDDIIAFRSSSGWATVFLNPIIIGELKKYNFRSSSGSITYYRFSHNSNIEGHFFEVYNATGGIVFSDGCSHMKVLGQSSGSYVGGKSTTAGATITSFSHSTSKTTAIIAGSVSFAMYWANSNNQHPTTIMQQAFSFNFGSIISLYSIMENNNYGSESTRYGVPYYDFLVIDVTNL